MIQAEAGYADLTDKAQHRLARIMTERGSGPLAVAESCTGGLISQLITSVSGSSAYFECGLVTYSNAAKSDLLGVEPHLLEKHGAVSREIALAMLDGLFSRTSATVGAAVTGIAGPDGGTPDKPVGTVWVAWGTFRARNAELLQLSGDRGEIREQAALRVLDRLCEAAAR